VMIEMSSITGDTDVYESNAGTPGQ
jgi:hypothetical protein